MNPTGSPQVVLCKGLTLYWRSAPWPWQTLAAATTVSLGFKYNCFYNEEEVSYAYFFDEPSVISRVVVDNSGYELKSPRAWYFRDSSKGCVRKQLGFSMCGNGEGFVKVAHLKPPDIFVAAWMDMSISSSECEQACLRNCSCTAFINYNIIRKGFSCLSFYGELMNILEFTDDGFDLNVRVDAAGFAKYTRKSIDFLGKKRKLAITIFSVAVSFLLSLLAYMWLMTKKEKERYQRLFGGK